MAEEIPKKGSSGGKRVWLIVGIVVVLAVIIWIATGTSGTTPQGTSNQTSGANTPTSTSTATSTPSQFSTLNIKAENGKFSPDTLTVQKGNPVMVNFTATDATYDLMFENPKIGFDVVAKKGETKIFGFDTKDKDTGSYTFRCNTDCGGASSSTMKGTLTIQ